MSGLSISTGFPCQEPDQLYVEVAGTGVGPGHELLLEKHGQTVSTLTMTQKRLHQRYQCDYAVDPVARRDHTLTLTVEKEQGGQLRLPLLDAPDPTRLSPRTQPNLLFPIYPLARMPWVEGESEPGHALLRPGYLYVFWKGILWRELETDATGKLRDVDLARVRERARQEASTELDQRESAGVALETLWVPARFQQAGGARWTIGDVELAWSEQQWSWDYIESLESGQDMLDLPTSYRELTGIPAYGKRDAQAINSRRRDRCENLSALDGYEHRRRFGPESHGGRDWAPLVQAAPCRRRNAGREQDASNPFRLTQALDGGGLDPDNTVLHRIRDELEALEGYTCKAQESIDFANGLTRWMDDLIGDDWRARSGSEDAAATGEQNADRTEAARRDLLESVRDRLQAAPAEEDQLAFLRDRDIPAVMLRDDLFELGWLTSQASLHLNHLSVVAESTQEHPHFKSAMLLHAAMFDQRAYERGPFDDYRHAVDMEKLDQALRREEREACRTTCYELIQRRIQLLEGRAVPVFNDLFALNGLRYPIALLTLNLLLAHLDTSVFHFDPLAGKATRSREAYRDNVGATFIRKLAEGRTGLAAFLTVEPDSVPLDRALDETPEVEPNDGSGIPRPGLMQWLQAQRPAPGDIPEALRELYELSQDERQNVHDNIRHMGDPILLRWAKSAYTTMGQLMADVSSELYLYTQRALLRNSASGPVYQIKDTLQIPVRYMKLGNPFLRGLVVGHANPMVPNANPEMVPLGIRFGTQATGIGSFSNEAIDNALNRTSGSEIVRPRGGVINRVGPGMSGNYAVIRNGNGRMIANATSVAGIQGNTPTAAVQLEMFLAQKDSVAARMSQGFINRSSTAVMRWAPPGMLGLFGWNVLNSAQTVLQSIGEGKAGAIAKNATLVFYGVSNLLYWLGHIVEAENLARQTRLSWLTKVRVDVEKISDPFLKSVARGLFADRLLSVAKLAGVFGASLEVLLSLWEGIQRMQANDSDAAAGYFTAAAGFSVFMFSHWAGTGLVPVLGVSVAAAVAAVALIVALGALAWAIFRTDDALETWLKNGPFGTVEPGDEFRHLHSVPEDAFQFLVAALFPLTGSCDSLPAFNDRGLLSEQERDWLLDNGRTEGHVIAVRSAAFLLTDKPEEQFRAHFWISVGRKAKPLTPEFVYYDEVRQMLRFHVPKPRWRRWGRSRSLERLTAEVQIALNNGALLPAGAMDQPLAPAIDEPAATGDNPRWFTITS